MFKKTNLFIVVAALGGLVAQSVQAVVIRAEIWRKQRSNGTYQNVLCASDLHYSGLVSSPNIKEQVSVAALSEKSLAQCKEMMDLVTKFPKYKDVRE